MLLLFPLFLPLHPIAQEQSSYYLKFSTGAGQTRMRDHVISPMIYKGVNIPLNLEYLKANEGMEAGWELRFHYSPDRTSLYPQNPDSRLRGFKLDLQYNNFSRVSEKKNPAFFLGGCWNTLVYPRLYHGTQYISGEFATSLNFYPMLKYSFSLGNREVEIKEGLFFPFVAFVIRPGYAYSPPSGFLEEEQSLFDKITESTKISPIHEFFRFQNRIDLNYKLLNENIIQLTYRFNYHQYPKPEPVKAGYHEVLIGTMFKF